MERINRIQKRISKKENKQILDAVEKDFNSIPEYVYHKTDLDHIVDLLGGIDPNTTRTPLGTFR